MSVLCFKKPSKKWKNRVRENEEAKFLNNAGTGFDLTKEVSFISLFLGIFIIFSVPS